jgi:hypothetical protein
MGTVQIFANSSHLGIEARPCLDTFRRALWSLLIFSAASLIDCIGYLKKGFKVAFQEGFRHCVNGPVLSSHRQHQGGEHQGDKKAFGYHDVFLTVRRWYVYMGEPGLYSSCIARWLLQKLLRQDSLLRRSFSARSCKFSRKINSACTWASVCWYRAAGWYNAGDCGKEPLVACCCSISNKAFKTSCSTGEISKYYVPHIMTQSSAKSSRRVA